MHTDNYVTYYLTNNARACSVVDYVTFFRSNETNGIHRQHCNNVIDETKTSWTRVFNIFFFNGGMHFKRGEGHDGETCRRRGGGTAEGLPRSARRTPSPKCPFTRMRCCSPSRTFVGYYTRVFVFRVFCSEKSNDGLLIVFASTAGKDTPTVRDKPCGEWHRVYLDDERAWLHALSCRHAQTRKRTVMCIAGTWVTVTGNLEMRFG